MTVVTRPVTHRMIFGAVPQRLRRVQVHGQDHDQVDREHDDENRGGEPQHQPSRVRALGLLAFEELRAHRFSVH